MWPCYIELPRTDVGTVGAIIQQGVFHIVDVSKVMPGGLEALVSADRSTIRPSLVLPGGRVRGY